MSLLKSLLLGIVQAITEFLPVSSYGHLILLEQLLQITTETGLLFEILLHIGSAVAIIIVFRNDFFRVCREYLQMLPDIWWNIKAYFHNQIHEAEEIEYQEVMNNNYRKFAGMHLISVLSSATVGLLFCKFSIHMSNSLLAVGLNFLVTAVLLLVVDLWKYGKVIPKDMTFLQAVLIGVGHGLGVFPGISSLGITITVCLLCGLRKNFAVRYAFLLSISTSIGAILLEIDEFAAPQMTLQLVGIYAAGMFITTVISLLCARLLLKIATKVRLRIFAIYSMLVGILAIVYNFM